jgi:hypothetical protein
MNGTWKFLTAVALCTAAAAPGRADGPFDELLARVPEQANALLLIDVEAARKSPLGVREHWAEKRRTQAPLNGLTDGHANLRKVVVATEFNPHTLQNAWDVAVLKFDGIVLKNELQKVTSGTPDTIGGREAVLSPQNAYWTLLDARDVGVMRPANRQAMARWVRSLRPTGRVALAPYLRDATDAMPKDAHAMMAFELADVFDEAGVRDRLKRAKPLAGTTADVEALTKLFAGVRGMALTLRVGDAIAGELRLDFSAEPAGLTPDVAKALVLDALAEAGAAVEDFDSWQPRLAGKAVVLNGTLSERGLRMAFSPFFLPDVPVGDGATGGAKGPAGGLSAAAASQQYFHSVRTLLDDLKAQKIKTFTETANWYNRFAQKIDALPILNVDDALLNYGASVSTALRGLANVAVNTRNARQTIAANQYNDVSQVPYYNSNLQFGGPGWSSLPQSFNNNREITNLLALASGNHKAIQNDTWKNLEAESTKVRQAMTKKYGVAFD